MRLRTVVSIAVLVGLGLWAASTGTQTQAAAGTAALRTIVPTDLPTTWNALIRKLDEGDFAINATIRENATIRVLLQSGVPSTWVDCGRISVHSKHNIFGDRSYDFLAANSVRYMVAHEELDELIDVERRTSLNALASVKLTPLGQGTQVDVAAHYVMKIRTREFGKRIEPRNFDESVDFTSSGSAVVTEEIREGAHTKTVTVACRPTGELERHIVAALGAPAS